jgi:exodeoxyribonuclease VII small subunit
MPREPRQTAETFEALYGRLEAAVSKLEQGGLSLDESIALYEEGMRLARACQERLDAAEQRITELRDSFAPLARNNGMALRDDGDARYGAEEDEGDAAT